MKEFPDKGHQPVWEPTTQAKWKVVVGRSPGTESDVWRTFLYEAFNIFQNPFPYMSPDFYFPET